MSLKSLMPEKCKVLDNIFISSEHNHHSSTVENKNSKGECWWSFRMWNLNIFLTHFSTKINLLSTHCQVLLRSSECTRITGMKHATLQLIWWSLTLNDEKSVDPLIHFDVQLLFGPTSQLSTMEIWLLLGDWSQRINSSAVEFPTKPGAANSVLGVETGRILRKAESESTISQILYFGYLQPSDSCRFIVFISSMICLFSVAKNMRMLSSWKTFKLLVSLYEPQLVKGRKSSKASWPPVSQETIGAPAKTQFSIVPHSRRVSHFIDVGYIWFHRGTVDGRKTQTIWDG